MPWYKKRTALGLGIFLLITGILLSFHFINAQSTKTAEYKRCVASINPQELEKCVFWGRNDRLRYKEDWYSKFKSIENQQYCDAKYNYRCTETSQLTGMVWPAPCADQLNNGNRYDDIKCYFSAFEHQKREENMNYLISNEKDDYYYSCVKQYCN